MTIRTILVYLLDIISNLHSSVSSTWRTWLRASVVDVVFVAVTGRPMSVDNDG